MLFRSRRNININFKSTLRILRIRLHQRCADNTDLQESEKKRECNIVHKRLIYFSKNKFFIVEVNTPKCNCFTLIYKMVLLLHFSETDRSSIFGPIIEPTLGPRLNKEIFGTFLYSFLSLTPSLTHSPFLSLTYSLFLLSLCQISHCLCIYHLPLSLHDIY